MDHSLVAKDLSAEEAAQRGELCTQLQGRVKDAQRRGREALWDLAEALHDFDSERGWGGLGYDRLADWLADPDVSMTMATYYRLVGVHRKLIVQRGLPVPTLRELDQSKVAIVLPAIERNEALTAEILDDVKALGAKDLREKYITSYYESTSHENGSPSPAPSEPVDDLEDGPIDAEVVTDAEPIPASEFDQAEAQEAREPTDEEWADIVERAKRRKRNLVKYVLEMTNWSLVGQDDQKRQSWQIPPDAPFVPNEAWATLRTELESAVASGSANPRIPSPVIAEGLRALDHLGVGR